LADLSAEELARLMRSKTDYLDFYERLKDLPLAVSRETGALLYMLARGCGARTVVEFGTSFGISRPCTSPQPCGTMAATA
jgi:predicted O-methyltransferase YrrM